MDEETGGLGCSIMMENGKRENNEQKQGTWLGPIAATVTKSNPIRRNNNNNNHNKRWWFKRWFRWHTNGTLRKLATQRSGWAKKLEWIWDDFPCWDAFREHFRRISVAFQLAQVCLRLHANNNCMQRAKLHRIGADYDRRRSGAMSTQIAQECQWLWPFFTLRR